MNSMKLFSETLIRNRIISRHYYTNRVDKNTLYSKISPLGNKQSVVPELEDWIKHGQKIRFAEIQRIIHDLRKRKRFSHALEVSEWINKNSVCTFSSTEHAVHLDLIGRVHGFGSAESYFNDLREEDKTNKTYGALLNCYVRQRQIDKSLSHLQKMKELGFASSALTYNDIMCLYTNIGLYEKVPEVLKEMKKNNVSPDNFSFRICINSYGTRSDLEGMEGIMREMEAQSHIVMDWNTYAVVANFYIKAGFRNKAVAALKEAEARLDKKDGTSYNHLISLYASLGEKDEVLRLWGLMKKDCKRYINRDFIVMLESLVKLGKLEEAEKVLKEWETSRNCYDSRIPNTLIVGYCQTGLYEKAEAMLDDLTEKGKATTPNSWGIVAAGYLDNGNLRKACQCMKAALSLRVENKGWKPNYRVVLSVLRWAGDEGSVEDVECFVEVLRDVKIPPKREMYHALLKASIKNGKGIDQVVDRMKGDKIAEDEETRRILDSWRKRVV